MCMNRRLGGKEVEKDKGNETAKVDGVRCVELHGVSEYICLGSHPGLAISNGLWVLYKSNIGRGR